MAAEQPTLSQVGLLNAGLEPDFSIQSGSAYSSTTGDPNSSSNSDNAVDVSPAHVTAVRVLPVVDCDFRVWVRWEGENDFDVIDGSERAGVDTNWSQTLNTAAVAELYVELTAVGGDVEIKIGPCMRGAP